MTDSWSLGTVIVSYLIHSSLLFAGAWLVCRFSAQSSFAHREFLWKCAMAGPFLTVPIQLLAGLGHSIEIGHLSPATSKPEAVSNGLADMNDSGVNDASAIQLASTNVSSDIDPEDFSFGSSGQLLPRDSDRADSPTQGSLTHTNALAPTEDSEASPKPFLHPIEPPAAQLELSAVTPPHSSETPRDRAIEARENPEADAMARSQSDKTGTSEGDVATSWFSGGAIIFQFVIWSITGWAILATGRLCFMSIRMTQLVRSAVPVSGPRVARMLSELRRQQGMRFKVEIRSTDQVTQPAACGLRRPIILLPAVAIEQLTNEELKATLGHELAHHARNDVAWRWLGLCVSSVFGFQPLNHFAVRNWHRCIEPQCDDWAVTRGVSPLTLASTLMKFADASNCPAPLPALSAASVLLTTRVERLLETTQSTRSRTPVSRLILITCGIFATLIGVVSSAPRLSVPSFVEEPVQTAGEPSVAGESLLTTRTTPEAAAISKLDGSSDVQVIDSELMSLRRDFRRLQELLSHESENLELHQLSIQLQDRMFVSILMAPSRSQILLSMKDHSRIALLPAHSLPITAASNGRLTPPPQRSNDSELLNEIRGLRSDIRRVAAILESKQQANADLEPARTRAPQAPMLSQMKRQLVELKMKEQQILDHYGPKHPQRKLALEQISVIEHAIDRIQAEDQKDKESDNAAIRTRIQQLEIELAALGLQVSDSHPRIVSITRQLETAQDFLSKLQDSENEVREIPEEPQCLLYFEAPWCGPCQQMDGIVNGLMEDGITIQRVNVDDAPSAARRFEVKAIPQLILIDRGEELGRLTGTQTAASIRSLWDKLDTGDSPGDSLEDPLDVKDEFED